ncbi:hypothetical protein Dimus_025242 [Dionaea muscipula]
MFYYEDLKEYDQGSSMARQAIEEALPEMDSLSGELYTVIEDLMEQLKSNLRVWCPDDEQSSHKGKEIISLDVEDIDPFTYRDILTFNVRQQLVGDCILHSILDTLEAKFEKIHKEKIKLSMKYVKDGMLRDGVIGHDLMGYEADYVNYEEMDDGNKTRFNMKDALDWIFQNGIVTEADFNAGVTIDSKRYRHHNYSAVKTKEDPRFPGNIIKEIKKNGPVMGVSSCAATILIKAYTKLRAGHLLKMMDQSHIMW